MTKEFTFNSEKHSYYLDGVQIPGVTSTIRRFVPQWQAGEFYLTRGAAVHLAVALALQGKLDESSVDERISGRVKAILKFLMDMKFNPVAVECRLVSRIHRYAGCLDYVGSFPADSLTLVDWKSSFEPSAEIQLGLYKHLWESNDERSIGRGVIVECRDDGSYKSHWLTARELKDAANVGLHMLSVQSWMERNGLNKKEEHGPFV